MADRYDQVAQWGAVRLYKSGRPVATSHLATACKENNTIREKKEISSEVWEKSAAVDSAEPNSKRILPH